MRNVCTQWGVHPIICGAAGIPHRVCYLWGTHPTAAAISEGANLSASPVTIAANAHTGAGGDNGIAKSVES
jgi:hypothetical protein